MQTLLEVFQDQFGRSYKSASDKHWLAALWASRVVGNYGRGDTLSMAESNGVSVDTIEDHAHAYWMFEQLCGIGPEHRKFVFAARRAKFIHYSHFRALYDAKEKYGLALDECFSILMDTVQAEGSISSRNIDQHAQERFGHDTPWEYHAQKAAKELSKALQRYPKKGSVVGKRVLLKAFNWIGDNL